jgi:hypothetical protein
VNDKEELNDLNRRIRVHCSSASDAVSDSLSID